MATATVGIFCSRNRGLVSWAIRQVTRSRVSHAGLVYYDETLGHTMVMHATGVGFNVIPLGRFRHESEIVALYVAERDAQLRQGLQDISLRLGLGYDFKGILGFLWVYVLRWFQVKRRNPFRDSGRMFCSELVARLLHRLPVHFTMDPETTSPDDLLHWLGQSPAFRLARLDEIGAR